MTSTSLNNFWDSCVLIRSITRNPIDGCGDIDRMADEAKAGKRQIWYSTVLLAELRPSLLTGSRYASISELVEELDGVLRPISPSPNILMRAARLRDRQYIAAKPQASEKPKTMTMGDAIQLATCLYVREGMGVSDIEFHTFDDGIGKTVEGRAVSLLRFEGYSEHVKVDPDVAAVRALKRIRPSLPQGSLV